jgi:hypothetical protein
MYPPVIQFDTKQMELEAALGLYGLNEALAQRELATTRTRADRFQASLAARLLALLGRRSAVDPRPAELRRIPLFASLPQRRFDLLVRTADPIDVPAGKVLIREGETGREFFAIAEGEVEISSASVAIREQAGDVFGEFALLYDVPRTATVTTTTTCRLFVLHAQAFRSVLTPSFA